MSKHATKMKKRFVRQSTLRPSHKFVARIPELGYIVARNQKTKGLELWAPAVGFPSRYIVLDNTEYEFVRPVRYACRVIDNEYNRKHSPNDIGRVFVDEAPTTAYTVQI